MATPGALLTIIYALEMAGLNPPDVRIAITQSLGANMLRFTKACMTI
jgi:hypothetical protein